MKDTEFVMYYGIRMIVNKRFEYKGAKKIEITNPQNGNQIVVFEYELNREIDQTIKE